MKYKVVSYCPDRHIEYDGETPYKTGVGGGVTARVRMAKALAQLGHDVTMAVNCREERWIDGVHYMPLDQFRSYDGDIAILNTSGGDLDFSPVQDLDLNVRLRVVWVHGVDKPVGLEKIKFDNIYAVSNFIATIVRDEWGIPGSKVFTSYNAFDEDLFKEPEEQNLIRDPFQLVYFSHPSKGLTTAIEVVRKLRAKDRRFHLVIYGGAQLWGQEEEGIFKEDGIEYRGLVGQHVLTDDLQRSAYSLQLQHRQEPGALSIVDALRAGCILLASQVGAFPEYVIDGKNGYLFSGNSEDHDLHLRVAQRILDISNKPKQIEEVRHSARAIIWDSITMARTWVSHWDWLSGNKLTIEGLCIQCEGRNVLFEDGYHCTACGYYHRSLTTKSI